MKSLRALYQCLFCLKLLRRKLLPENSSSTSLQRVALRCVVSLSSCYLGRPWPTQAPPMATPLNSTESDHAARSQELLAVRGGGGRNARRCPLAELCFTGRKPWNTVGLEQVFSFCHFSRNGGKKISTRTMWVYGVHTLGKRMYFSHRFSNTIDLCKLTF